MNVLELNLALDRDALMARQAAKLFTREIVTRATIDSFKKLDPRIQIRNPVMFVVEVGSVITTATFLINLINGGGQPLWFTGDIAIWLWLTVLFANFAEAIAEGRGKAQADSLRAMRTTTLANRRRDDGTRRAGAGARAAARRRRRGGGRRADPGRRRRDRGHRLGRRVGHHRRVGAGHPRVRRRPLGGHRRHPAALRPARGRRSPRSRASRSSTA